MMMENDLDKSKPAKKFAMYFEEAKTIKDAVTE